MEIRFNIRDNEFELVKECAKSRGVSMEVLIREATLDKIEYDINRLEAMLVSARKQLEQDRIYGSVEILDI